MKPNFFGMCMNNPKSLPTEVKFDSYRFWDDGCRWALINEMSGLFNTIALDDWTRKLEVTRSKDILFELGSTPTWASSSPQGTECNYPTQPGNCSPPSDLHADGTGPNLHWRQWCSFIARYFSKLPELTVSGWCTWNEFDRQADTSANKSWLGTNQQMVRLSEDARAIILGRGRITATGENVQQVLKTVGLQTAAYSKAATSVMVSPSGGGDAFALKKVQSYLATPGASVAAEVFAVHLYSTLAATAVENCVLYKKGIAQWLGSKKVWSTEGSFGKLALAEDPAKFVTEYYTGLYPLVDRVYWYSYDGEAVLWDGQKLTNAGLAYNAVYEKLTTSTV